MLSPYEAFEIAAPRRPAVLCIKRGEATEMIATDWFTWLNMKNQPMISYAMQRSAAMGMDLRADDELYLAFPAMQDVEKYEKGILAKPGEQSDAVRVVSAQGLPVMIPAGCDVVIKCTLHRAYNYPFKKVRIFNCNFEDAVKNPK